ncbi:uncharacterized protein MKK02DRAFT_40069 [Dioszegia hungarica]|uniref:Uncharacterized protein n=1 Tax=Dioszegia hungarica TaxID=4972 RepID=A0AA38HI22_9TREE|nr:uncharacterized protein MKK02DRAFT_40069 [Dioszegia hungarica]KAI9639744.1 hypothetical protein MKK02DRAFT_40069 [Dioszegia hungarica]
MSIETFTIPGVSYATFFTGKEGDDEAVPAFKIVLKNASKFPQSILSGHTATDKTSHEAHSAGPAPVSVQRQSRSLFPSLSGFKQSLSRSLSRSRDRSAASTSEQGLAETYLLAESKHLLAEQQAQGLRLRKLLEQMTPHAYQQSLKDWLRDQPPDSGSTIAEDEVVIYLTPKVVDKDEAIPYGGAVVNLETYFATSANDLRGSRELILTGRDKFRTSNCKEGVEHLPASERDYLLVLASAVNSVNERLSARGDQRGDAPSVIRDNVQASSGSCIMSLRPMVNKVKEDDEDREQVWGIEKNSSYLSTASEKFWDILWKAKVVEERPLRGKKTVLLIDTPN